MVNFNDSLFPHPKIRKTQDELIKLVSDSIANKKNLVVHAPTGLGKTAATISPALEYAIAHKKVVFFLTSRQTQHMIVVNTLRQIKRKHNVEFVASDIIGKKGLCCQSGVFDLYSNEFNEYCKNMREHKKCDFFVNTKDSSGKISKKAYDVLEELKVLNPCHAEDILAISKKEKVCGYEMAAFLAKEASVIIADYSYIFNPSIRNSFFQRTGFKLEDCIIIVDEGHNLPKRCRELLTSRMSTFMIERAVQEADKFGNDLLVEKLSLIRDVIKKLGVQLDEKTQEKLISKKELVDAISISYDYGSMIEEFESIAKTIRTKQKQSYIGSISDFLNSWLGQEEAFARILTKNFGKNTGFILTYRCLDPSMVTKEVIDNCHNMVLMSGTLIPTYMYKDLIGISNGIEKEFISPFPKNNRLNIIIPETSSKFTSRNEMQYGAIAKICSRLVNEIKGNCVIFFPSYSFRDDVLKKFDILCKKTIFVEQPGLSKQEKEEVLERFKEYKDIGAVLLGVASGSFGEGIDLPGDYLNGVIIVGIPLQRPDLETKELINYYEKKYGKGWDYGYILPAITKCLQNAGRCIRSETDKGVIAFVDERFVQHKYLKCFPLDWDIKISKDFSKVIEDFYKRV